MRAAADGLVALGFRGANVTMPHKTQSAALADELSEDARRLQAVNTFVVDGERLARTQHRRARVRPVPAARRGLRPGGALGAGVRRRRRGPGGGARAGVRRPRARCRVAVGTPARADDLRGDGTRSPGRGRRRGRAVRGSRGPRARSGGERHAARLRRGDGAPAARAARGRARGRPALPTRPRRRCRSRARDAGADAFGGLGMLLHQAALSFELWTGGPAPLDVMSAAAVPRSPSCADAARRPTARRDRRLGSRA